MLHMEMLPRFTWVVPECQHYPAMLLPLGFEPLRILGLHFCFAVCVAVCLRYLASRSQKKTRHVSDAESSHGIAQLTALSAMASG